MIKINLANQSVFMAELPLPPSHNNMYSTIFQRGKPIRIPSVELKMFNQAMDRWALCRSDELSRALRFFRECAAIGLKFKIDRFFFFEYSRIISKEGNVKIMDASNRVKALDDGVSKIIGVDDKLFFRGSEEKAICDQGMAESCAVLLSVVRERRSSEVLSQINLI